MYTEQQLSDKDPFKASNMILLRSLCSYMIFTCKFIDESVACEILKLRGGTAGTCGRIHTITEISRIASFVFVSVKKIRK